MDKRQAFFFSGIGVMLAWISACVPLTPILPTPTPSPSPVVIPTSTPILVEPSPTPKKCTETRGQVQGHVFDASALPHFYIYLPPCYDFYADTRYPVLYLIHGAGFEDDQWIRLGVADEVPPYIIVMPYNKYSTRLVKDDDFGEIFIEELLPYIEENFRTKAEAKYRAIGGLSRGGGWAIHYALTRYELFGALGAHSPAIFRYDFRVLDNWLEELPASSVPRIYIDAGDKDQDRKEILEFVDLLAQENIAHEWRLFSGAHDEDYWRAHVSEYLRWYGEGWE